MQWKPLFGFEGSYEISEDGNVRSVDRFVVSRLGVRQNYKGQTISAWMHHSGYLYFTVRRNSKKTNLQVHRLVALSFLGQCPEDFDVCHNDGNSLNNHVSNLRFASRKENMADARAHGTLAHGEKRSTSKLKTKDVAKIWEMSKNASVSQISAHFPVQPNTISRILNGRRWKQTSIDLGYLK